MQSHFLHMLVFSAIISTFFAVLVRRERRSRLRLGGLLWLGMVGGGILLAYLMYPFPN